MDQHFAPRLAADGHGPIHAQPVVDEARLAFLPRHFGPFYLAAEQGVYRTLRRLCPHYRGGLWDFYDLSNGGALLVPTDALAYDLRCEGNGYAGRLPALATGIGVCAMAYSQLSFHGDGPRFADMYYRLRDFLAQQPEAGELFALLD